MNKQLNCIGDTCPVPVIKTKKALEATDFNVLEVLVDNEVSVQNIQKFVESKGNFLCAYDKQDEYFSILISKKDNSTEITASDSSYETEKVALDKKTIVVISSEYMGVGENTLGEKLMQGFIFAVSQLEKLPEAILFYNTGVRLCLQDSKCLKDLEAMENAGVRILACGMCLEFFEKQDKLRVGEITNMYNIVEMMQLANRILRP